LVGIGPLLLNKFVERKTYGIQPSVRSGKGRGGRRLFSPDDALGIALVWWLFESGLRSGVIQVVLDQICRPTKGVASAAAKKLVEQHIETVRVRTVPRRMHRGLKLPRYLVQLITQEKRNVVSGVSIELAIDVGHLYSILLAKMKRLTGLPEGE
jgi:DNA-binding transcriptional MerR regulator